MELNDRDRLLSEIFGLKVVTMAFLLAYFEDHPDKNAAGQRLATVVSNTVDMWDFRDLQEPKLSLVKEAMRERAFSIISSALNPDQIPPERQI